MIDLHHLREFPELYKVACIKKRIKFDIDSFLKLDEDRRSALARTEQLRSQLNSLSKEVPKLTGKEKEDLLAKLKDLSTEQKDLTSQLKELEEVWQRDQLLIPAPPLDSVPDGKDDTENVEIRRVGEIPKFDFPILDHVELGERLGLIDAERAVKIAGARNYFLTGDGARLHHAVLQFAIQFITKRGYQLMEPPHIVQYQAMMGTGYFPGGEEMAYQLDSRDEGHFLIGTSEVPVAAYHLNELLSQKELPKRYSGYSACYRREAGTYGKDTRGLYRVHQFYKVEQVVICEADDKISAEFHKELLGNSEQLLQAFGLPYRVVDVCSGDMGQGQVYKNDIETWMPSRNAYSETHSCSTLHAFQARRLNLRYKDNEGKNIYCHTLNNTLVASPRVLIPILELNQQKDGSVRIPPALVPFMGGQEVIVPVKGK
jgi:seryl-tRNA synthetase